MVVRTPVFWFQSGLPSLNYALESLPLVPQNFCVLTSQPVFTGPGCPGAGLARRPQGAGQSAGHPLALIHSFYPWPCGGSCVGRCDSRTSSWGVREVATDAMSITMLATEPVRSTISADR